jgi:urease accessory protein
MHGRLRLVFRARGPRTYLAESYARSPLKILRQFDLADGRAVVQILQTTPGVFAGDDYEMEIVVDRGARVVIMNPSATKLHRMTGTGFATQRFHVSVHEDAHLEYYPALTIPFPEADFRQSLHIDLHPKARLALLERWAMGRVERGEYLLFRRLSARTAVHLAGKPLYRDALELTPSANDSGDWGVLEAERYSASGFWFGECVKPVEPLPEVPLDSLQALGEVEPGQHYFRGLFSDGVEMDRAVGRAVQRMCRAWGLADPPLRPFSC